MTSQEPGQHKNANKPTSDEMPESTRPLPQPDEGTPMDKFNKTLRKILSVPKKDISKK